jgi:hypothetical protein
MLTAPCAPESGRDALPRVLAEQQLGPTRFMESDGVRGKEPLLAPDAENVSCPLARSRWRLVIDGAMR